MDWTESLTSLQAALERAQQARAELEAFETQAAAEIKTENLVRPEETDLTASVTWNAPALQQAATDALRELERAYSFIEQIYTGPNPMDEHCISDLRTALAASAAAKVSLGTLEPPRDYPEADDENARAAMEAERDALQARVKDLERVNANLLRDIEYLNGRLDAALQRAQEAKP